MTEISRATNMGQSGPLRRGSVTMAIPQPIEGLDTPIVLVAEFEFEIIRIWRRTQDGDCEITFYNDGEIIELDDAETNGEISADEGAANQTLPDSTDEMNYTVVEGGRLSMIVDNCSTSLNGLEIQIDYQKTLVNDND